MPASHFKCVKCSSFSHSVGVGISRDLVAFSNSLNISGRAGASLAHERNVTLNIDQPAPAAQYRDGSLLRNKLDR
jgi:hypothetical protein